MTTEYYNKIPVYPVYPVPLYPEPICPISTYSQLVYPYWEVKTTWGAVSNNKDQDMCPN